MSTAEMPTGASPTQPLDDSASSWVDVAEEIAAEKSRSIAPAAAAESSNHQGNDAASSSAGFSPRTASTNFHRDNDPDDQDPTQVNQEPEGGTAVSAVRVPKLDMASVIAARHASITDKDIIDDPEEDDDDDDTSKKPHPYEDTNAQKKILTVASTHSVGSDLFLDSTDMAHFSPVSGAKSPSPTTAPCPLAAKEPPTPSQTLRWNCCRTSRLAVLLQPRQERLHHPRIPFQHLSSNSSTPTTCKTSLRGGIPKSPDNGSSARPVPRDPCSNRLAVRVRTR